MGPVLEVPRLATVAATRRTAVWQYSQWDVQLRQGESYAAKWEYVRCNPVRHDLVKAPEDWPWAGEMETLAWHEP